jgi:conjugative relaxase-like TrwC/TraI family protein
MGIEGKPIEAGDEAFERLRENLHPVTGQKLTPRTNEYREASYVEAHKALVDKWRYEGKDGEPSSWEVENHRVTMPPQVNRVAFYDFQCGAPKSVSVMALVAGDQRVRIAHAESVKVALAELEQFAACRSKEILGRLKRHDFTGEICAAMFEHDASRALDPQLHTHCVVANATWDKNRGRWSALTEYEMVHAIRYAGKVYQNDLAIRLKALGYQVVEEHDKRGNVIGWEIEGVSKEVRHEFSRRRREIDSGIEAFRAQYGRAPSSAEIGVITRETREKKLDKSNPQTAEKVRAAQLARIKADDLISLRKLVDTAPPPKSGGPEKEKAALTAAIAHGFERASVKKAHAILADALNAALGSVDLKRLKRALMRGEGGSQLLANESDNQLVAEFATKEGVKTEEWSVGFVNATNGKFPPIADKASVEKSGLSGEQKEAVEFVCRSRNQVVAVRGVAGAGKTTMLKALDRELNAGGRDMLYLAPTASAVKTLQREGFENATTVADYLTHAAKTPFANAVIVIDEAGLQSNRQGAEALALAQKHRQRVVFVGDSRQHVSVEAGDFLRILETHSKLESRELKNIRRQIADDYRQAVIAMADGKTAAGMEQLDAMGWIHEGKAKYLQEAAEAWMDKSKQGTKAADVVCVAPTWEENFALSQEIRDRLKSAGKLGDSVEVEAVHSLKWTKEQKSRLAELAEATPGLLVTPVAHLSGLEQSRSYPVESVEGGFVRLAGGHMLNAQKDAKRFDVGTPRRLEIAQGDQLLIRMNDKARGLINGQVVTVESVRPDGSIRTQCGKEIPSTFRQFAHGYVVTSHKAQGRTARHVIVAAARVDSKAAYVGCSRGRESCDVFTPDKDRLFDGLAFDGNRRAALDVLKEQRHAARVSTSRPPSVVNRIKSVATSAMRRAVHAGRDRLRNHAVFARRWNTPQEQQVEKRTKKKVKTL